ADEEERIVIPTVYRNNYLAALRALSLNGHPVPLTRVLDYAQRWTRAVPWTTVEETRRILELCNAFIRPDEADERGVRLQLPQAVIA
ncbi:MAG TPA: hypothetical protein VGR70_20605, partial [Stellaceae bacterium]|nr:hypothetical protein [Stellaceae bacterium]